MIPATRWFITVAIAALALTMITQARAQKVPKPDFKQYKRIHQKALDLIRTGKAKTAIKFLAIVEEKLPKDAETQYMLAVAQCTLGQTDAAEASVEKALKFGLVDQFTKDGGKTINQTGLTNKHVKQQHNLTINN